MERDALSEQEQRRGSSSHDAKKSQRDRMLGEEGWRDERKEGCSDYSAAYEGTRGSTSAAVRVVRDNHRSRWPASFLSFVSLHLLRLGVFGFLARKRYRISCVYLGMRGRAARNSIRRSRTEDGGFATKIGSGRTRIMRAYTARMIEDEFTKEQANLSGAGNELHIRYASGLLELPREDAERKSKLVLANNEHLSITSNCQFNRKFAT